MLHSSFIWSPTASRPNSAYPGNQMASLTLKAQVAADMVIQYVADFQAQLAPLDAACDAIIDSMTKLKNGETITDDDLHKMDEAKRRLAGWQTACLSLSGVVSACTLIDKELEL